MIDLIACRAIQGIGAGGLMVGAQAIIGDVIPARQRGRYMGYFGAVFGLSSVLGPLAGGWFTQHLSWRWVFYINVPIGIVALFIVAAVLHIPAKRVHHKIDWLGISLLSAGVTGDHPPDDLGRHPVRVGVVARSSDSGSVVRPFWWVLLRRDARAAEPIIPLGLFKGRTFTAATRVGFIIGFAMFGAIVYLPLYLQTVHGASPTASGLELLPMVAGMLTTFIVSGRLVTRTGRYKIFPIVGSAMLAVGLAMLAQLGPHTSFGVAAIYMFIVGLGVGLVMQVLVVAVQNSVPYSQLGTATSTATFFRTIGGGFGVSALGTVFDNRLLTAAEDARPLGTAERRFGWKHHRKPRPNQSLPAGRARGVRERLQSRAAGSVPCRGAVRRPRSPVELPHEGDPAAHDGSYTECFAGCR